MVTRIKKFQGIIWGYHQKHRRDMPWRRTKNPYFLAVSEIMLQQTQIARVGPKYREFLIEFPTLKDLSNASLSKVFEAWQGLGYNRRAMNLKRMAAMVTRNHKGAFPKNYVALLALPGIGQSTAGALMNFAWNIPTPFIETNIRSVYIHHFFKNKKKVSDAEILKLVEKTMDLKNPREWFYALYDYGTMLKKEIGNVGRKSTHYKKQSAFKGSNRELRSKILKYILKEKDGTSKRLFHYLKKECASLKTSDLKNKIASNLEQYVKEGTLKKKGLTYTIQA